MWGLYNEELQYKGTSRIDLTATASLLSSDSTQVQKGKAHVLTKSDGTELVMYILFCTSLHIYCTYIQFKRRWKAHKAIGLLYPLSGTKKKVKVWRVYKSLKHTKEPPLPPTTVYLLFLKFSSCQTKIFTFTLKSIVYCTFFIFFLIWTGSLIFKKSY